MHALPRDSEARAKILTLVQFHAALATLLLAVAGNNSKPANEKQNGNARLTALVTYLHFWCATLGFGWWYAATAQSMGSVDDGGDGGDGNGDANDRLRQHSGWAQAG